VPSIQVRGPTGSWYLATCAPIRVRAASSALRVDSSESGGAAAAAMHHDETAITALCVHFMR
jgi:hypothetical protein